MADLKRSAIPLYTQIASSLRHEVQIGTWPVGSKLPAMHHLANRFGVATQTMRQALALLENEGLVLRKQGVGTVIQKDPRELRWLELPTDWQSLVGMLDKLDVHVLLVEASDRTPKLRAGEGKPVSAYKYVKRVHYRNDEPFGMVEFYLSAEIYLRAPKQFRKKTIIPVLAGLKDLGITKVRQSIAIDVADAETAKQLDIPLANPIAKVRRSIVDKSGAVIYVADAHYRSDVIRLDMDLSPSKKRQ